MMRPLGIEQGLGAGVLRQLTCSMQVSNCKEAVGLLTLRPRGLPIAANDRLVDGPLAATNSRGTFHFSEPVTPPFCDSKTIIL